MKRNKIILALCVFSAFLAIFFSRPKVSYACDSMCNDGCGCRSLGQACGAGTPTCSDVKACHGSGAGSCYFNSPPDCGCGGCNGDGDCTSGPPATPPDYDSQCTATSFPRAIVPGGTANVSVTMKNTGGFTWTPGENYRLGSANPYNNMTFGVARAFMAGGSSVATNSSYTFNFTLTAPVTQGTYSSKWQMLRELVTWFGPTCGPDTLYVAPRPTCTGVTTTLSPTTFEGAGPTIRMWASGVSPTVDALWFPTWSTDVSGWDASSPPRWTSQDDLVWHVGTNAGGGSWYADIPMPSHHFNGATYDLGRIQTDVWMRTPIWDCSPGNCTYCGGVAHNRVNAGPPLSTIQFNGQMMGVRNNGVIGNTASSYTTNATTASGSTGLNNTQLYRRYWIEATGVWSAWLSTGFSDWNGIPTTTMPCGGALTCLQNRWWTPTAFAASGVTPASGDIALGPAANPRTRSWQVVVNATRNDGRWCSGNPDLVPSLPNYDRCDPTTRVYDYLNITLAPPTYNVSGNLRQGNDCSSVTALAGYQGGSSVRGFGPLGVYIGTIGAGGSYNIPVTGGGSLISVCPNLVPPPNTAYVLTCADVNGVAGTRSGGCLTGLNNDFFWNPTLNFYYRIDNARPWTTSLDGDVYIGSGTTMTVPTATLNTFDGYLIDNVGVGAFAFANANLDVIGTTRISQSPGSYGYSFKSGTNTVDMSGMWPSNFTATVNVPAGAVAMPNPPVNLNPASVYTVSLATLNTILSSAVTYSLSADGVAVVYVPDAAGTITFSSTFQSNNANRRIIFMTSRPVVFSGALVTPPAITTATAATVQAGIVTTSTVSFPKKAGWAVGNYDATLIVEGPLLASAGISMQRDAGPTGNLFPPEVVRYYQRSIYNLTQQERINNANFTGVFINNVTWSTN